MRGNQRMASARRARLTDTGEIDTAPVRGWTALLSSEPELAFSAINCNYRASGVATVFIARRIDAAVLCAHFVVDLLAFGVTDCFGEAFEARQFEEYLADVDRRLPLEWCSPVRAAEIIRYGAEHGERNGVPQPDELSLWSRILPAVTAPAEPEASVFGAGRFPLAVPVMAMASQVCDSGGWILDERPGLPLIPIRRVTDH